jgi:GDP-fucose transporter C1
MLPTSAIEKSSTLSNQMYIFYVICAYWVVSISMVYLNKILLSSDDASIPAPLFVTWYQCVVTCLICKVLGYAGEYTRLEGSKSFLDQFPIVSYEFNTGMQVLPLSLVFVGMITFNNICLQMVAVSFCKSTRFI